MPLLPNPNAVNVSPLKVRDFLLDPNHPNNNGRARVFLALGYSSVQWRILQRDLRDMALPWEAIEVSSPFGHRFLVSGMLIGPAGASPVRTVWEIRDGTDAASFVTAYPRRRL